MKNTTKLAAALLLTIFGATNAMAAPTAGTTKGQDIEFTGNVIAAACSFDLTSAGSGTVNLGELTKTDVIAANSWKEFTVKLTGCDATDVNKVEISSADVKNEGMIYNKGTAKGVGIKLASGAGVEYSRLNTTPIAATNNGNFGQFAFKATMAQDINNNSGTISTGTVSGTMTITVTYN